MISRHINENQFKDSIDREKEINRNKKKDYSQFLDL
jgi:hypothetical protein